MERVKNKITISDKDKKDALRNYERVYRKN